MAAQLWQGNWRVAYPIMRKVLDINICDTRGSLSWGLGMLEGSPYFQQSYKLALWKLSAAWWSLEVVGVVTGTPPSITSFVEEHIMAAQTWDTILGSMWPFLIFQAGINHLGDSTHGRIGGVTDRIQWSQLVAWHWFAHCSGFKQLNSQPFHGFKCFARQGEDSSSHADRIRPCLAKG